MQMEEDEGQVCTCEHSGLVGLLILSSWKGFPPTGLPPSSRTEAFSCGSFALCWGGGRQHAAPLPLQPVHGAAQLLDALGLQGQVFVQTLDPEPRGCLGLALVPARTGLGLQRNSVTFRFFN